MNGSHGFLTNGVARVEFKNGRIHSNSFYFISIHSISFWFIISFRFILFQFDPFYFIPVDSISFRFILFHAGLFTFIQFTRFHYETNQKHSFRNSSNSFFEQLKFIFLFFSKKNSFFEQTHKFYSQINAQFFMNNSSCTIFSNAKIEPSKTSLEQNACAS